MNKEELFTEFLKSNKRNDDSRRTHSYDDTPQFSALLKEVMKQAREERLEREKVFGKPRSKYHR